jgi:hypothetical protein
MKMMMVFVVSLLLPMMIAHAEGIMSTGVLQKVTCVAGGVPFTVRLEKCFLGAFSFDDVRNEDDPTQAALRRKDISDARVHVAIDFGSRGKYAIIVTRENQTEKKDILGIYYYDNRSGRLPSFGPYTSLFWSQHEEALYWVVIPQRKRLREADIHILKLDPLKPLNMSYQEFINTPTKTWIQPHMPLAKYEVKNIAGDADYIPLWIWINVVAFNYDPVKNMVKVDLVDDGYDGGTLTISYEIPRDAWTRTFTPSQQRLEREGEREKDKQRYLRENAVRQEKTP